MWIDAREAGKRYGVTLRHLGMQAANGKIQRRPKPGVTTVKVPWQYIDAEAREAAVNYRMERNMAPRYSADRECLRCGQSFVSAGVHNRLCTRCAGLRSTVGRSDGDFVYAEGGWPRPNHLDP